MNIETFPINIKQLIEGNRFAYKSSFQVSDYMFTKNKKIEYNQTTINVEIVVDADDLTMFEFFHHYHCSLGNKPFYAHFYFSEYDTGDNIFRFIGAYSATHLSLGIYKISFQVKLVQ